VVRRNKYYIQSPIYFGRSLKYI